MTEWKGLPWPWWVAMTTACAWGVFGLGWMVCAGLRGEL